MCFNDGQQIIDLFVNYDCDLRNSNLFERTVTGLVRRAQGTILGAESEKAHQQEIIMREETLKCLNIMLNALIEWHAESSRQYSIRSSSHDDEGTSSSQNTNKDISSEPIIASVL